MIGNLKRYWQVSDKVNAEVIKSCTDGCEREDCQLSARIGRTTLAGGSDHYNKEGQLIIWNPNKCDVEVTCCRCWNAWKVETDGFESKNTVTKL